MAHIDLTPEEIEFYRDMPVIYDDQLGFFFEASSDGKMKLCNVRPLIAPSQAKRVAQVLTTITGVCRLHTHHRASAVWRRKARNDQCAAEPRHP